MPYPYMPVAAALLYILIVSLLRAAYVYFIHQTTIRSKQRAQVSKSMRTPPILAKQRHHERMRPSLPREFWIFVTVALCALVGYSFAVGQVQGALAKIQHAQFDPYATLELSVTDVAAGNTTLITNAYRTLLQRYHPSNKETGDPQQWQAITLAYRTLTEEAAKLNWERYGHPNGVLLTPWFDFPWPPPAWLSIKQFVLKPSKKLEAELPDIPVWCERAMLAVYAVLTLLTLAYGLRLYYQTALAETDDPDEEDDDDDNDDDNPLDMNAMMTILPADFAYLANTAKASMTRWELLTMIVASPGNLKWATKDLSKIDKIRRERIKADQDQENSPNKKKKKQDPTMDFDALLNEGGWADVDDEDENEEEREARIKAQQAEEEKQKDMEQLNETQEKSVQLLEDLDDGVLGQKWVEQTLKSVGAWPPQDLGVLQGQRFAYKGQDLAPLDHPGIRRMLCMISGRLNSQMLNSHNELLQAGAAKKIDQTYFTSSMTFRNRVGMLLEATLRIASAVRCYRLAKTVVETVAMFKVGCILNSGTEAWFKAMMMQQYGCLPLLQVTNQSVATPDEKEVATGDDTELVFELVRSYAENFLRQKIMMCQKQGIPPQIGLQTYREGWFVMIRGERLDGKTKPVKIDREDAALGHMQLDERVLTAFENEDPKHQLLASFPMSVMNVSQKAINLKVPFKAPHTAGKYRFTVDVLSLDFLAADMSFSVSCDVVEASKIPRKPRAQKTVAEDPKESEPKKEK